MSHPVLQLFHPLICRWFSEKFGEPTDIQQIAWPHIARGEHVLITAPTGSGKTLTAFLWALQQLITGEWQGGETRVLYVSPLKALNNDVRRNLLKPLQELEQYFTAHNEAFPVIRVLTRSGDTPQEERRQMLRKPPEILITTPESLNLILSSKNSRKMLSGIRTVILDEIHAVLATKRGTHLITAVDRLVPLAGEFQRIALSATISPATEAADFVAGLILQRKGDDYHYQKREVTVCQSTVKKKYFLQVDTVAPGSERDGLWRELAKTLCARVRQNRSTLIFCNNRRLVEKLTRFINDFAGETLVYSHHGSLARELRLAVEEKLKKGELKGIVATNSLELGIDIGELDEVLLVQTPPSLSSAVQRIGRAGHSVGQVSRGTLYPVHGLDFVEAAATSINLSAKETEPLYPVEAPLDVLSQVIISMTAVEKWDVDELYAFLKTSWPYRNLSRKSYELVLQMLAGRYAETRLRELNPRIIWDKLDNTVKAREGAECLLYLGGGTIPDRGYYNLRLAETKAKIGELDEEFVWERSINDTFLLGTQLWQIVRITHSDVEVVPGERAFNIIPFWRAEEQLRDFFSAEKIGLFLEKADEWLQHDPDGFINKLIAEYNWTQEAAARLADYLLLQKTATGTPLPHRHHLLIEQIIDAGQNPEGRQVVLHTFWGGKVNKPLALILAAAWEEKFNCRLEVYANNHSVMLQLPAHFDPPDLFTLLENMEMEKLLRKSLESSSFFGARFRENAGRALLLPKTSFKKRMPLWLSRLKAKKLLEAVSRFADFPILVETWRNCLRDEFDLPALQLLLDEIRSGEIAVSETVTHVPSPFCADLLWRKVNNYVYEDDTPFSDVPSRLRDELLWELLDLKRQPDIPQALVRELDGKLKRTAQGYSPADEEEFMLWLKERLFIPFSEAEELFQALVRDHAVKLDDFLRKLGGKAAWISLPRTEEKGLCALEILPRICRALQVDLTEINPAPLQDAVADKLAEGLQKLTGMPEETSGEEERYETPLFVGQWLSYYGPVTAGFVQKTLGLTAEAWAEIRDILAEVESIVIYKQAGDAAGEILCDRENMERLLRMARLARRPRVRALPIEKLPLFLAVYQGVAEKGSTLSDLQQRLEPLLGYVTYARLWEEAILPARMEPYYRAWMDSILQTSDLLWFGRGNKKIGFCFRDDLPLFPLAEDDAKEEKREAARLLFPDPEGRYDFLALCRYTGMSTEELTHRLWECVWRGYVANDSMAALRSAILNDFKASPLEGGRRGLGYRRGFKRWVATRPLQGSWYLLSQSDEGDPVEREELVKERIRLLLLRYGVLFRELLQQELPGLRWGEIFRTLRLMEFSGEVYAGHFFDRLSGLQFIGKEAYRLLQADLDEECIYWLNACDPASPCGLKLSGLDEDLPARVLTNFVVFHGSALKVVAKSNGKALLIKTDPDDPHLPDYLAFFKTLLTRDFNPLHSVKVETINGEPALSSPYKKALQEAGFERQYKFLELRRQYY